MTKRERRAYESMRNNRDASDAWRLCNDVFNDADTIPGAWRRFRHCTAWVLTCRNEKTGDKLHILRSYKTIVACVLESDNTGVRVFYCVDMLRKVYGYTNTSGQHIAKFFNDYAVFPARVLNAGETGEKARVIIFRHDGGREQGEYVNA